MNSLYVKILVFIVFILLVYFMFNSSNKKEKFVNDMSGNRFDDLLMIRRRIERVMGPKELVKLSVNNISEMMSKFNDFFYVLVDSGNVGSKMNAYYFANHLGMDTVNKYYIGNMQGLNIPPFLKNFVIKPINLSSSRGLLIIKDRVDILDNNVFDKGDILPMRIWVDTLVLNDRLENLKNLKDKRKEIAKYDIYRFFHWISLRYKKLLLKKKKNLILKMLILI